MRKLLFKIVTTSLIILSTILISGKNTLRFDHISLSNNILGRKAKCIVEDRKGFVWIGMSTGLLRFDGYRILHVENRSSDGASIRFNDIMSLCVVDNNLWIGTIQGLFVYNLVSGITTPLNPKTFGELHVHVIKKISNGDIAVGTNGGAFICKKDNINFITYRSNKGFSNSLSSDNINSIYEDTDKNLWFGTSNKLNKLDKSTGKFIQYNFKIGGNRRSNTIYDITSDRNNDSLLYFGTGGGLAIFNRFTLQSREISTKDGLSNNVVKSINFIKEDEIWVGTENGLNIIDLKNMEVYPQFHDFTDKTSVSNDVINQVVKGEFNYIWIATNKGIDRFCKRKNKILYNRFSELSLQFSEGKHVNDFVKDSDGNIFIATGDGLYVYNLKLNIYKQFKYPEITGNKVSGLHIDQSGILWAVTEGGLNVIDPKTQKIIKYEPDVNNDSSIGTDNLSCITEDSYGNIWIGSHDNGVFRVVKGDNNVLSFINYKKGASGALPSNIITDISADSSYRLWIATNKGLHSLNLMNGNIKNYSNESSLYQSVGYIYKIETHNDEVFIAASGGLFRFNKSNEQYYILSDIPNVISLARSGDDIWFTSFHSLFKYSTTKSEISKIPSREAIIQHFTGAVYSTTDGNICFGGYEGFISFDSENIVFDSTSPKIEISEFRVNNLSSNKFKTISPYLNINDDIVLKHDENNFNILFSTPSSDIDVRRKYRFILEGFQNEWSNAMSYGSSASFTGIPPGEYRFRIQATDNRGVFSDDERSLNIRVKPLIWLSVWAKIIYLILIVTIAYIWLRMYISSINNRNNLKLIKVKNEKSEELIQMKVRFFTNISHELRTPLTLISSPLKTVMDNEKDSQKLKYLNLIKQNSERLLKLVNQLLDVQKVEKGEEILHLKKGDFVNCCNTIFKQFSIEAVHRSINLQYVSKLLGVSIFFDHEKIEKILYNLLSNAFKFTPDGGTITLETEKETQYGRDGDKIEFMVIRISDTGEGISEEDLGGVFDRYSNVKVFNYSIQEGSGIGLSLVKDYAEIQNGFVTVDSKLGGGSCFSVYIPMNLQPDDDISESELSDTEQDKSSLSDVHTDKLTTSREFMVLIVEDNNDMREFLKESLSENFRVMVASNGEEGLKFLNSEKPDLVVADVMMPVMNGFEMCNSIKSNLATSHIPVVLLTAKSGENSKITGIETGADDYINKPFNIDYLKLRVQKLIEKQKSIKKKYMLLNEIEPTKVEVESIEKDFLKEVKSMVEKHIDNPELNVKMLSQLMGISNTLLYRKIKSLTGQTANEFIRTIRLKRAAQLLKQKEMNVKEVRFMVGFSNSSYFTRSFKEMFGVVPKDYKG